MISLNSEIPITEAELEKKIGTLIYLQNLKKEKENSTEIDPCPICCFVSNCGVCIIINSFNNFHIVHNKFYFVFN